MTCRCEDIITCRRTKCDCECHPRNGGNAIMKSVRHDGPLFPIRLCIYGIPGSSDEARYTSLTIEHDDQLMSLTSRLLVRIAVDEGRKVVMEDCMGLCVFHAEDGKILFPEESHE